MVELNLSNNMTLLVKRQSRHDATDRLSFSFCTVAKNNGTFFIDQNNQADVEKATEVLSGYLERDISQDSLQDIKQKVQDKYRWVKVHVRCAACVCWNVVLDVEKKKKKILCRCRYCESRRRVLLQHVHEGYEKDLWEYIED